MTDVYDLHLRHGDTYRRTFVIGSLEDNLPMDLTGCVVTAQIRRNPMSTALVQISCSVAADQVTNKGQVTIAITGDQYSGLLRYPEETEHGGWDLNIVWPSLDTSTAVEGTVYVQGDYTYV